MIVLTQNGRLVNPACQPYDNAPEAEMLRKRLAEPQKGEVPSDSQRQRKVFVTHQAQFARLGFELKSKQHPAGVTLFEVSRHGQTRIFSHFGDVGAYLTQLQQGGHHG